MVFVPCRQSKERSATALAATFIVCTTPFSRTLFTAHVKVLIIVFVFRRSKGRASFLIF